MERGATVLQEVHSVYETDGFQHVMDWVAAETGTRYGESDVATKAHRVLADHGRAMTFLVADGVTPSNEGRGYVLRRVVRRAVVHGRNLELESFLPRLAGVVVEQMGGVYPELVEQREAVARVLAVEEEKFGETLARGSALRGGGGQGRHQREGRIRSPGDLRLPRRDDRRARPSVASRSTSTSSGV